MCEINPKHADTFIIEVYTSHPTMTRQEFDELVTEALVRAEMQLNLVGLLRFHVHHYEPETIRLANERLRRK